jgi:hypothetical protein
LAAFFAELNSQGLTPLPHVTLPFAHSPSFALDQSVDKQVNEKT